PQLHSAEPETLQACQMGKPGHHAARAYPPKSSRGTRVNSSRRDPTTEGRLPAVGNAVQRTAVIVSRPEGGRRFPPREPERNEEIRTAVESATGAEARCVQRGGGAGGAHLRASKGDG